MNKVLLARRKDEQRELGTLRQRMNELQDVCTDNTALCIGIEGERSEETAVEYQVRGGPSLLLLYVEFENGISQL